MVIAHGHEPQLQIVDADLHENHVGQGRKQGLRLAPCHVIAEHNKEFVAPDALHRSDACGPPPRPQGARAD